MKIGLVLDHFDPRRGGVEQWTARFAHWLVRAGHEVHVVASSFADDALATGITAHEVRGTRTRTGFAAAVEHRLRTLRLDVVHDTGCGWYCDVLQPHGGARRAAFEQNQLLLPRAWRPWKRALARWLPRYREFDRLVARQYADDGRTIIAISKMVARDLARYHGVRPERMRLVYNGVDLVQFTPQNRARYRTPLREKLGVGPDEVLLLIVAHNFALKGVPTLLRAVGRLAASGAPVRLAVAGGKRHAAAARLAARVGVGPRVTFLGSVDDAAPWYAAADVYVQPTFYDPCSLVVLEAFAAGLPVVTSRFNGAGELLTEGREGYLVDDPANVEELAERLRPLLDAGARERMGIAARQLAERHSWDRNCREMLDVYSEIAETRRLAA
ncbi:MAG: glycosyltransferase family 4 protein [Pirellulales bacterium]|nr:glycosyltransferase family 4 protein [Pirellulales bacterium]